MSPSATADGRSLASGLAGDGPIVDRHPSGRRLKTDLLFRRFLDLSPEEAVFVPTAFTHNREWRAEHGLTSRLFGGVVKQAQSAGLASDEHFTVDGSLIQSHASIKSLKRIASEAGDDAYGCDDRPSPGGGGPPAQPQRKRRLPRRARHRIWVATLSADAGYDAEEFLQALERAEVTPHVALRTPGFGRGVEGGEARAAMRQRRRRVGYWKRQRRRKVVEEFFGWAKTVSVLRRSRHVGHWKIAPQLKITALAFNLVRMRKLLAA